MTFSVVLPTFRKSAQEKQGNIAGHMGPLNCCAEPQTVVILRNRRRFFYSRVEAPRLTGSRVSVLICVTQVRAGGK